MKGIGDAKGMDKVKHESMMYQSRTIRTMKLNTEICSSSSDNDASFLRFRTGAPALSFLNYLRS